MFITHFELIWNEIIVYFRYEEHNELVKNTIPKENLLVWNLKEGWEPLCTFLNVPISDEPVPKENVTGDLAWVQQYMYQDKVVRSGFLYLACYSALILGLIILLICLPFIFV